MIARGDVFWADLPAPAGSGAGYRHPVVVVQNDGMNASRLATVVAVPLTSQLRWADAPGNVLLRPAETGLPKDSVASAAQILAIDKVFLDKRVGHLSASILDRVLRGIDVVLGRSTPAG